MTIIRSNAGIKIETDNSANIFFITGEGNTNLKAYESGLIEILPTSKLIVPVGNTVQRPSVSETGAIRLNTETQKFEVYQGSYWDILSGDSLYDKTILHITGDGENNKTNESYLEKSSNAFVVTKFGNPVQGSFNPYQAGWSVFFDDQGDYISNVSSAIFSMSADGWYDFTIEGWIYQFGSRAFPNEGRDIIWDARSSDNTSGPLFGITGSTGQLEIAANTSTNSGANHRSANTIIANQWNHVAFVRQSNTLYYYINGQLDANTFLLDIPYTATTPKIGGTNLGALAGNASSFHGLISNFRYTRDAVYTDSFTVPTAPLTELPNTVILTCQDPYINDNSTYKNTLVGAGETYVVPFSPFGRSNVRYNPNITAGSIFMDGTNADYLTIPYDSRQNIGSNVQYCFEFWHYPNNVGAITGKEHLIACRNWTFGSSGPTWGLNIDDGVTPIFNIAGTGSAAQTLLASARSGQLRQWNHYVFTRDFTGMNRIFVNGVLGAARSDIQALTSGSGDVFIGTATNLRGNVNGYIAGLHMIVGDSIPELYKTANTTIGKIEFTPPRTPPVRTDNTVFLLNFENAGIYDSTQVNNIDTVGDVKIITDSSPYFYYGNSSISFDGNSYLFIPNKTQQVLGYGPFTIESWIYRKDSNTHTIFNDGNTFFEGLQLSVIDDLLVLNEGWANVSIASTVPGSVRFAGKTTNDYVEYDGNAVARPYKFGSNNFTIEFWTYPEREGVLEGLVTVWQTGGSWQIAKYANSSISFAHNVTPGSTTTRPIGTGVAGVTSNAWNHIAITKEWAEEGSPRSGNLRIFINGLLQGANTNHIQPVELYQSSNKPLRLGIGSDRNNPFEGKLADVRIINGDCLYTANFTVPDSPLTIVSSNVSFLSCQHGIADSSKYNTSYFVPRLGGSNGNILITRDSPYDANNFTTRVPTNTWVHVAAVRSSNAGNQTSLYINGKNVANGTLRVNFFDANTAILIGENQTQANGFFGYMRDFRLTRGARYASDFTPPFGMPKRGT